MDEWKTAIFWQNITGNDEEAGSGVQPNIGSVPQIK
jgi:hypothetical protein